MKHDVVVVRNGHRRSGLTPEVHDIIVEHVRQGMYYNMAALAAGVPWRNVYRWLELGRKADDDYQKRLTVDAEAESPVDSYWSLWQDVKEAEALFQADKIATINAAASPGVKSRKVKRDSTGKYEVETNETGGDWLAAMTMLERRFPDQFARRERKQVDITETRNIKVTHVEVRLAGQDAEPAITEAESRERLSSETD
jgi:hypothetical protein